MRLFRHNFVTNTVGLSLCCLALLVLAFFAREMPVAAEPMPLAGVCILVDAGHGGYDGGSRAKDSGVWEKEINLAVAKETKRVLEKRGATVLMSREEDSDLCDDGMKGISKKRQDLTRRLEIARAGGADVLLSIHMNEYRSRKESGPHVFYRKGHASSRLLAGCLQKALIENVKPLRERVAQAGDYFMLSLEIPSVLVECGFLSNADEEKKLLNKEYHILLAEGIANGLMDYLNLQDVI
jgi:N-acetylmuramoyl-L-alanine amidase